MIFDVFTRNILQLKIKSVFGLFFSIIRGRGPTFRNSARESTTFSSIAKVNANGVQSKGLTLGEFGISFIFRWHNRRKKKDPTVIIIIRKIQLKFRPHVRMSSWKIWSSPDRLFAIEGKQRIPYQASLSEWMTKLVWEVIGKRQILFRAMTRQELVGRHYRQRSEETGYTEEDDSNKMLLKIRAANIRETAGKNTGLSQTIHL